MTLKTRRPTGKPGWPIILLAGIEKAGKTYAAAVATASKATQGGYWISFGEAAPEEYDELGRFEIVQHESTYRDLLRAIDDVNAVEGTHVLVIDSMSRVWDMLKDETQESAWRRAAEKAKRSNQRFDKLADEVKPSMDLWNLAAQRWQHIMAAIREHKGPVILTARLDEVNVIGPRDQPTGEKAWSIQGHKSLPFDVTAIVEMRAYRTALIRGVRSLRWKAGPDELVPMKDFTVEKLWVALGIESAEHQPQQEVDAARSVDADETEARIATRRSEVLGEIASLAPSRDQREKIAAGWLEQHGHAIATTYDIAALEAVRDSLREAA